MKMNSSTTTTTKPLNPNAREWRPFLPPSLPHLIYHPPTTLPPPPPRPRPMEYSLSWVQKGPWAAPRPPRVRKALPPRLRTAPATKMPPPPKNVWIRKYPKAVTQHSGGRGGAARSPPSPSSLRTTVMIKNIPNRLWRDCMLGFLDECCRIHTLEYDFFYLPMDFRARNNLGYAFANFTTEDAAKKIMGILEGYRWEREQTTSKKMCQITWARVQGKEALMRRFQNSNFTCDSLEFLPVVLDPPRNGSDPNPPPPVIVGRLYRRY